MLNVTISIPVIEELDLDVRRIEAAVDAGARSVMRRKGLAEGKNLVGAHAAAVEAASDEAADQLERSRSQARWHPRTVT